MWLPWTLIVFVHCFVAVSPKWWWPLMLKFGEIKSYNVPNTSTTNSIQSFSFYTIIFSLRKMCFHFIFLAWGPAFENSHFMALLFIKRTIMTIISSMGNQFEFRDLSRLSYPSLLAVCWSVFIRRLSNAKCENMKMKFH